MHVSVFLLLFAVTCVQCKNNVKSLTESMGQEVIEIGTPIKDLPPGLDEEPSAEADDDETTSTTVQPATKRETRKTTTTAPTTMTKKTETEKNDVLSQEDEESRIEKELSEIYKDTDYKTEAIKETTKKIVELKAEKPIARARTNFKFQPDVNDRADVERFRTSIDEISCDKRVTQRLSEVKQVMLNYIILEHICSSIHCVIAFTREDCGQVLSQVVHLLPAPANDGGMRLTYTAEDSSGAEGQMTSTIVMCLAFLSVIVCQ